MFIRGRMNRNPNNERELTLGRSKKTPTELAAGVIGFGLFGRLCLSNELLSGSGFHLLFSGKLDIPSQSAKFKAANDDPAQVELPPLQAVTG